MQVQHCHVLLGPCSPLNSLRLIFLLYKMGWNGEIMSLAEGCRKDDIKSCTCKILNLKVLCTDVCDSSKFSQHRPSSQILNILPLPHSAGDLP